MPLMNSMFAESIAELQRRVEHADANPIVENALNGDQNPITVSHQMMRPLLGSLSGGEWHHMRELLQRASGTVSREYPCAWIRALVKALEG